MNALMNPQPGAPPQPPILFVPRRADSLLRGFPNYVQFSSMSGANVYLATKNGAVWRSSENACPYGMTRHGPFSTISSEFIDKKIWLCVPKMLGLQSNPLLARPNPDKKWKCSPSFGNQWICHAEDWSDFFILELPKTASNARVLATIRRLHPEIEKSQVIFQGRRAMYSTNPKGASLVGDGRLARNPIARALSRFGKPSKIRSRNPGLPGIGGFQLPDLTIRPGALGPIVPPGGLLGGGAGPAPAPSGEMPGGAPDGGAPGGAPAGGAAPGMGWPGYGWGWGWQSPYARPGYAPAPAMTSGYTEAEGWYSASTQERPPIAGVSWVKIEEGKRGSLRIPGEVPIDVTIEEIITGQDGILRVRVRPSQATNPPVAYLVNPPPPPPPPPAFPSAIRGQTMPHIESTLAPGFVTPPPPPPQTFGMFQTPPGPGPTTSPQGIPAYPVPPQGIPAYPVPPQGIPAFPTGRTATMPMGPGGFAQPPEGATVGGTLITPQRVPTIGGYLTWPPPPRKGGSRKKRVNKAATCLLRTVTGVVPNTGTASTTIPVTITGTNFASGDPVTFTHTLGTQLTVSNIVYVNSTTITADVLVDESAAIGSYDVCVGPPSCVGCQRGGFSVT